MVVDMLFEELQVDITGSSDVGFLGSDRTRTPANQPGWRALPMLGQRHWRNAETSVSGSASIGAEPRSSTGTKRTPITMTKISPLSRIALRLMRNKFNLNMKRKYGSMR